MIGKVSVNSIEQGGFSFADNTTYGCGGNADGAFYPKSEEEAAAAYDHLKSSGKKFTVIGNGSNVLASDRGYDGFVLSTKKLAGITRDGNACFALAGTTVKYLLNYCALNGLGGVEYLAGIPATVGGLAFMNGGAHSEYISDNIISVRFYDGKFTDLAKKDCNFGYKYSTMRDVNGIITGVLLDLHPQSPAVTRKKIGAFLSLRAVQPSGRTCGCVFKNPQGAPAGKLIEEAGLKGKSVGKAFVSCKHANFIVNEGGSSSDVYKLIQTVKERVYSFCGVVLEEEVVYIGDFK